MTNEVEIYGLFDPRTEIIMYVGKANDSTKRLKSHLSDSKRRNTRSVKSDEIREKLREKGVYIG